MASRIGPRLITSLVALVLCAELVALATYYVETGALFYTHRRTYQEPLPTPEDRLVVREAVHPYFGFTHLPATPFDIPETLRLAGTPAPRLQTNNFGFVSPHSYPFAKTHDNQFVIGIFGGSVGVWFCQVGAPRLAADLKRHPFFRDKELVPLCFSHEGYKQPQQALVLAYFLSLGQPFDLVVNIDGFNDVALAALNNERGLDISMPSVQHLDPLVNLVNQSALTPEKLESLATIVRDRQRLVNQTARIRGNRIASVDFVLDRYYRRVLDGYVRELGRFSNLPSNPPENALIQVTRSAKPRSGETLFTDSAAVWSSSSLLMSDMLARRGAAYFHFLQPNQYYSTRTFTGPEAATALSDASPYKKNVEQGYPVLLTTADAALVGRNVAFVDATRALDREAAPVYLDNCCHYTLVGNQVLADFIATSILTRPGPWNE